MQAQHISAYYAQRYLAACSRDYVPLKERFALQARMGEYTLRSEDQRTPKPRVYSLSALYNQ